MSNSPPTFKICKKKLLIFVRNSTIRSLDLTDTFHQEDTVTLTEEEKKEATQMQKEERRLRRQNQLAHEALMAKQKAGQSGPAGTVLTSKPVLNVTVTPMDFQSTKANQPQGFDRTLKDPQTQLDSMTSKFRPHPTYQASMQHQNTTPLPRPASYETPSHLMPVPASSTQVQPKDPTPSTLVTTSAGEDKLPVTAINSDQDNLPPTTKVSAGQDILSVNERK